MCEYNKIAWFFDEKNTIIEGKWKSIKSLNHNKNIFSFNCKEYFLTNEQINIAEISKNIYDDTLKEILVFLSNTMNLPWIEKEVTPPFFKKIIINKKNILLTKTNSINWKRSQNLLLNKILTLINKMTSSIVILMETLTINYETYTLKKKNIIIELYSLLESFGIFWHYFHKFDFENVAPEKEDHNTIDNWKEFHNSLLKLYRENNKDSVFLNLIPEAIEKVKMLRKILVHQEKVFDNKKKMNIHYSIDFMTINEKTKDLKKIRLIKEGYNSKEGSTETFKIQEKKNISCEEIIDIYKLLDIVSEFIYFWFFYIFKAKEQIK